MSPNEPPVTALLAKRRVPDANAEFWHQLEAALSGEQPATAAACRDDAQPGGGRDAGSTEPDLAAPELELYTAIVEPATPQPGGAQISRKLWLAASAAAIVVLVIGVIGLRRSNPSSVSGSPSSAGATPSSATSPVDPDPTEVVARPFDVSLLLDPFDPTAESANAQQLRRTVEQLPWNSRDDAHLDPIEATNAYLDFIDDTFSGTFDATVVGQRASSAPTLQEVEVRLPQYEEPPFETPTVTVFVYQSSIDETWWVVGSESSMITVTSPTPGPITSLTAFTIERDHGGLGDLIEWVILPHDSASVYRFDWTQLERLIGPDNSGSVGPDVSMWCGQVCSVLGRAGTNGTAIVITPRAATTVPITFSGQ